MEFLVLITAFLVFLVLANYAKKWHLSLPKFKRIKHSLIITSTIYIVLLIFFIISLVKYFNYLSLITFIFFTGFILYTINVGIEKLKQINKIN
jgi:amino acid transporter